MATSRNRTGTGTTSAPAAAAAAAAAATVVKGAPPPLPHSKPASRCSPLSGAAAAVVIAVLIALLLAGVHTVAGREPSSQASRGQRPPRQREAAHPPPPPSAGKGLLPSDVSGALQRARQLRHSDPWAGLAALEGVSSTDALESIVIDETRADLLSSSKQRAQAIALRRGAQARRASTGLNESMYRVVAGHTALAQDLRDSQLYSEALVAAQAGLDAAGDLDPGLSAVLLRLSSQLQDCSGDVHSALKTFNRARKATAAAAAASGPTGAPGAAIDTVDELLQQLQLTRRLFSIHGDAVEARLAALLRHQSAGIVAAMLQRGPWTHPQQLPRSFVPGLASRPWHSVGGDFPSLAPVEALLRAATADLAAEAGSISDLLAPETECIHTGGNGAWRTFMVNGVWLRERDADGCSLRTPVACGLLRAAAAAGPLGFRVLRGGYSVVDAQAHLHPHCGISNAQLKFHLGLVVPRDPETGAPCASIRVGNETRAWEQGQVLFFDDSFEHEVWNRCAATRSVFQLVFAHPDLGGYLARGGKDPFPRSAPGPTH